MHKYSITARKSPNYVLVPHALCTYDFKTALNLVPEPWVRGWTALRHSN